MKPPLPVIVAGVSYQVAFLFAGAMSLVSLTLLRLLIAPAWNGQKVGTVAIEPVP